jgi:hypothetical protein
MRNGKPNCDLACGWLAAAMQTASQILSLRAKLNLACSSYPNLKVNLSTQKV